MEILFYLILPAVVSGTVVFLLVRALFCVKVTSEVPAWAFYWLATLAAFVLGPIVGLVCILLFAEVFSMSNRGDLAFALITGVLFLPGIVGGISGSVSAIVLSRRNR